MDGTLVGTREPLRPLKLLQPPGAALKRAAFWALRGMCRGPAVDPGPCSQCGVP